MDLQMTSTPVGQLEIKYEKEAKKVDEGDDDLVKWTSTESKYKEDLGTDQQQLQNQHIDILNNKLKASTDKNEYFESQIADLNEKIDVLSAESRELAMIKSQ